METFAPKEGAVAPKERRIAANKRSDATKERRFAANEGSVAAEEGRSAAKGEGFPKKGEGFPKKGESFPKKGEGFPKKGECFPKKGEAFSAGHTEKTPAFSLDQRLFRRCSRVSTAPDAPYAPSTAAGRHCALQTPGLERGGKAFGQGVVARMARAAHAAGDAPGGGALRAGGGGGWHAAIAVMEQAGWRRLALRGEAAFADLKRAGQRAHRKLLTERFHHRATLAGTSADKIPNAFLRSHAAGAGNRSRRSMDTCCASTFAQESW